MKSTENEQAHALADALQFVNELRIQVVSRDRILGLKERAKLTRQLFKSLGLKGISVRVPTGANCFCVCVTLPGMEHDQAVCRRSVRDDTTCAGCIYYRKSSLKIEEILARAFPREVDNSDYASDYFDFPWFIR